MPIFEYQCKVCKKKYEIFHVGREIEEDIVCPSCNSREYKKWFSPAAISSKNTLSSQCSEGSCKMNEGGCEEGFCPMN